MTPLYFGCFGQPGHHFNRAQRGQLLHVWEGIPEPFQRIDGRFAPMNGRDEAPQGQATVTVLEGWTCLAFWDRSGDHRGNSNSAFILPGELSFSDALVAAKEAFPMVFARFGFDVVEFKP